MTDDIRRTVRIALMDQHKTMTAVAHEVGLNGSHVSDLLTGKRGGLSKAWTGIFDNLGLELIVRPKEGEAS